MADIREKSNNIYKLDDRYYVKKISNCSCIRKEDDRYLLTCRIKGRGEKDYYVDDDPEYIRRDSKRLWLSDEARVQIKEAVDDFKERAEELQGDSSIKIEIKPCNTVICLRKRNETEYDFLLEIKNPHNISGCSNLLLLLESSDVGSMIKELSFHIAGDDKTVDLIRHSTPETISENPIYQSAVKTDDPYMQRIIKLYYHIADEDDCRWLSDNVMGMEILPSLSEEYNKGYYTNRGETNGRETNGLRTAQGEIQGRQVLTEPDREVGPGRRYGLEGSGSDSGRILVKPKTRERMRSAGIVG